MWRAQTNNPDTQKGGKPTPSIEKSGITSQNTKSENTIDLVFKVWAPNLNRVSHRLLLLGSLKQLGTWNIQNAARSYPTEDQHTWKVEVRGIPTNSSFEWVWVKLRHNRTDVKWESTNKRTRKLECFGGVIHTIFGDEEEVFIRSATYVEVSTYRKVEDHQCIVLTGCTQTAGCWDLDKALKAIEQPKSSGYWKCQLAFDSSSCLQFKWAIINEKDGQLHLMEKESHSLCGRRSWLRAVAPWNTARVFVEDSPICLDQPDMMTGRTDLLVNTKKARLKSIRNWLKKDPVLKLSALMPVSEVKAPTKTNARTRNTPTKTDKEQARRALLSIMYHGPNSAGPGVKLSLDSGTSKATTITSNKYAVKVAKVKKNKEKDQKPEGEMETPVLQDIKPSEGMALIKGKGQTIVTKTSSKTGPEQQPGSAISGSIGGQTGPEQQPGYATSGSIGGETGPEQQHRHLTSGSILGYLSDTLVSLQKWDFSDSSLSNMVRNAVSDFGLFKTSDDSDKEVKSAIASTCCSKADINDDSGFDSWSQLTQTVDDSLAGFWKDKTDNIEPPMGIVSECNKGDSWRDVSQYSYFPNVKLAHADFDKDFSFAVDKHDVKSIDDGEFCYFNLCNKEFDAENAFDDQYLDMISLKVLEEETNVDEITRCKNSNFLHEPNKMEIDDEIDINGTIRETDQIMQLDGNQLEDNGLGFMSMVDFDTQNEDLLIEKRMIARKLEQEWGSQTQNDSSLCFDKDNWMCNRYLDSSSVIESIQSSCFPPASIDDTGLFSTETSCNDIVRYSNIELENMIGPTPNSVDRRSIARMMEENWGRQPKEIVINK